MEDTTETHLNPNKNIGNFTSGDLDFEDESSETVTLSGEQVVVASFVVAVREIHLQPYRDIVPKCIPLS